MEQSSTAKRPKGVTILAVFLFGSVAAGLLSQIILLYLNILQPSQLALQLTEDLFYLIIAIGIWKLKNWARIIIVILDGFGFLFLTVFIFLYRSWLLTSRWEMALWFSALVLLLWPPVYLLLPHVKQAFLTTTPDPLGAAPFA